MRELFQEFRGKSLGILGSTLRAGKIAHFSSTHKEIIIYDL